MLISVHNVDRMLKIHCYETELTFNELKRSSSKKVALCRNSILEIRNEGHKNDGER